MAGQVVSNTSSSQHRLYQVRRGGVASISNTCERVTQVMNYANPSRHRSYQVHRGGPSHELHESLTASPVSGAPRRRGKQQVHLLDSQFTDLYPGRTLSLRIQRLHTHLLSKLAAARSSRTAEDHRRRQREQNQELGVANESSGDLRTLPVQRKRTAT